MNMTTSFIACGVVPLAVFYVFKLLQRRLSHKRPYPPGPPGLPLVGNLFDFPRGNNWKTFAKWAQEYGDLVYVTITGSPILIVNSSSVVSALFEGKGGIYSDRPRINFLDISGANVAPVMLDDGPEFKQFRRLLAREIGSKAAVQNFVPGIETEIHRFLEKVIEQPGWEALPSHIRHMVGATVLDITYGYQVKEGTDELVDLVEKTLDAFSNAAIPGAHLVDTMPWLEYLPSWVPGISGYREEAKQMGKLYLTSLNVPYEFAVEQITKGTARPSMISHHFDPNMSASDEFMLRRTASMLYGGGADTTVSSLYHFFAYMALYPDVQRRAQAEIDALTGGDRLPSAADKKQLPYVGAVIKELLRHAVVGPGTPHRLRADDVHEGYFIPKDTVVIPNLWYMLHDPRVYTDPDTFNPERFLGPSPEPDPQQVWSVGRRICPGRYLAEETDWLAVMCILATLKVSKLTDKEGSEIDPKLRWMGLIVAHLEPFECKVEPRSAKAEMLVRSAVSASERGMNYTP